MADSLRLYIAHNGGLHVMDSVGGKTISVGEFFHGKTLEHLVASPRNPEVVFAAVAFDGGYRTRDAGRTWEKVMDGDVRTYPSSAPRERASRSN